MVHFFGVPKTLLMQTDFTEEAERREPPASYLSVALLFAPSCVSKLNFEDAADGSWRSVLF